MRVIATSSMLLWLAGCGASTSRAAPGANEPGLEAPVELGEGHPDELEPPASRPLFVSSEPRSESRFRVRSLAAPHDTSRPLGTRRLVDVRFADAELQEALRLLSDAGGFAFIAEGELSGRVTTELRRVRPYDALVAIAEAHGARVERRGNILVVRPGRR